jgi:hypothetical protein
MNKNLAWKWVGCGCGAVALFILVIAAAVALNWPRVTRVYQQAKTGISSLMRVSNTLHDKYGGRVGMTVTSRTGVDGTILRITLTNPEFLAQGDPSSEVAKQKALEVATTARDALDPQSRYPHYEIVFERQSGSGISVSQTWSFSFNAADLPPK